MSTQTFTNPALYPNPDITETFSWRQSVSAWLNSTHFIGCILGESDQSFVSKEQQELGLFMDSYQAIITLSANVSWFQVAALPDWL